MKKMISILITFVMVIALVGCGGDSNEHVGEAKSPSGSSVQKGSDYQSVIDNFEEKGFKNIKTEKLEDLITGWLTKDGEVETVSIGGDHDYSPDVWYSNDVEVVITYHTFPADNEKPESPTQTPSEQEVPPLENSEENLATALEAIFPVENAKRAVVVSITNYFAVDVFAEDRTTYDKSKFHSYEDASGNFYDYYLTVNSLGTWSAKDNKSWHVDSLILKNSFGLEIDATLDVTFDGTNYLISNITGMMGDHVDLSEMETTKNSSLFLVISPEQIKNDRSNTSADSHLSWVNEQFSSWDGSHKTLTDIIKKNLNDEKSFKHIETTYQAIISEEMKNEYNEMLKSAKKDERVEIGDLWITTNFSAKNAYNATVKSTAYAISSFSNNTVTLIAIE